ncbi:tumor necrosis factor receptor superfamily member 5 [Notolabrus celidotus]|uniref:tumor necrosis factor receptor superfamily member 5 n=1 Tax=Notolabrus celidotus TaxID=1203425 RepID=UPI00148FA89F|nr:tumor necrosis factor receptor superfamily member 5 [Notolabrus celidotus]
MSCLSEDKYVTKDDRCCDRCPSGWYIRGECDGTKKTECAECVRGFFTETKNHWFKCLSCKDCSTKNQRKVKDCTAQEDTVCGCEPGFFCINQSCDHCQRVKHCPLGQGVKVQATRTNNTICAVCEEGTFNNVTDFHSPCKTHTRCGDLGRVLKTPGTPTADAICGDCKTYCHWIIPASLWSGLVLTALVLFGLYCWRRQRKSSRAASLIVPVTLTDKVPVEPVCLLELPLQSKKQNGHCIESCMEEDYKFPLFTPDDNAVSYITEDSVDSSHPITPLKVSVSFAESSQQNGSAGFCTGNFLRTHSEPQEDEWCGTEAS